MNIQQVQVLHRLEEGALIKLSEVGGGFLFFHFFILKINKKNNLIFKIFP